MSIKRLILLSVFIACIGILSVSDGVEKRIKSGDLEYCKGLGWVNWQHAKPNATIKAYKQLQALNCNALDSFDFQYAQRMKYKVANRYIVSEFVECRKCKPNLTAEEEKEFFLDIFVSVSDSFEKMQGSFPHNFVTRSYNSSYRDGDMTGNLISYYVATSELTIKEVRDKLVVLNKDDALTRYAKTGLNKVSWDSIHIDRSDSVLEKLGHVQGQIKQKHIAYCRQLSNKSHVYIEKVP